VIRRWTVEERVAAQVRADARIARAQELLRTCAVCHEVAAERLDTMQGIRICEFCAELEASGEPPRYGR
jgi:formylmethanofuran dehydrogenase subunit E